MTDRDPLGEWFDGLEAPEERPTPAALWARDVFAALEAPAERELPSTTWAREVAEQSQAPASIQRPAAESGALPSIAFSFAGAALAAAAALLFLVLRPDAGRAVPPTTDVASVDLAPPAEPRTEAQPIVHSLDYQSRTDGVEFRAGSVRLLILDPENE